MSYIPNPKMHFYVSLIKSIIRIAAGGALVLVCSPGSILLNQIEWAGGLLILAELLGILEEVI
jgi:hypothetical protein